MPDSPRDARNQGPRRDTARVKGRESARDTSKVEDEVQTPMRVIVFAPKLRLDGTTLYTKVLLRALQERQHSVMLVAESGPMAETITGTFDEWHDAPPRLGLFAWRRLKEQMTDFDPQVLHAVAPDPSLPAVKSAAVLSRPLAVSVHGVKPHEMPKVGDTDYSAYIASDQSVRERLLNDCRLDRNHTTLISDAAYPEIAPDEREILSDRKRPVIGWVSPLVEGCAYNAFIEAAMKTQGAGVDAMFSMLGSGPIGPEVRDAVEDRGMLQRIVVVQSLYDYSRIWAPFDIAVVDTRQTGSAMMVLHAMASGRPVIATEGGVVFDLIHDGVDGLIVPREDPNALAERILMLVQNPPERLRMARAAFEKVEEHYRPRIMAHALGSVYAALLHDEPLPKTFETRVVKRSSRSNAG